MILRAVSERRQAYCFETKLNKQMRKTKWLWIVFGGSGGGGGAVAVEVWQSRRSRRYTTGECEYNEFHEFWKLLVNWWSVCGERSRCETDAMLRYIFEWLPAYRMPQYVGISQIE